ncbi:MAG: SHOCT domain-containing protein [Oscillospiraceae bacterium]|nr:SHOCT domain-containing protein [Oscillospiraceae bacterium]
MPYYYSSSDSIAIYLISIIISLVVGIIFGCITKGINENKGYDGGFAWGFWLGWIGIIVVACRQPCVYTPTESIIVPAKNAVQTVSAPPGQIDASGSWRCRCGRVNARFVSSCACGLSKREATEPATPAVSKNDTDAENELKNISLLKEYKALLDSGVITQEEFDAKKASILSK